MSLTSGRLIFLLLFLIVLFLCVYYTNKIPIEFISQALPSAPPYFTLMIMSILSQTKISNFNFPKNLKARKKTIIALQKEDNLISSYRKLDDKIGENYETKNIEDDIRGNISLRFLVLSKIINQECKLPSFSSNEVSVFYDNSDEKLLSKIGNRSRTLANRFRSDKNFKENAIFAAKKSKKDYQSFSRMHSFTKKDVLSIVKEFAFFHSFKIYEHDFDHLPSCLIKTNARKVIYVRKSIGRVKKSFYICHEIAHERLSHVSKFDDFFSNEKFKSKYDSQEDQANIYALSSLYFILEDIAKNKHKESVFQLSAPLF